MFKPMKRIVLGIMLVGMAQGQVDQEKYAQFTQDEVRLDVETGLVKFNDQYIKFEELPAKLKQSYSVVVHADGIRQRGGKYSIQPLPKLFKMVKEAGIDARLVSVNAHCLPEDRPPFKKYDTIEIQADGSIRVNKEAVELAELTTQLSTDGGIIIRGDSGPLAQRRVFLEVLESVGSSDRICQLTCSNFKQQIRIEAEIFQMNDDGSKKVLTAPRITTKAGSMAMMGVGENQSGFRRGPGEFDAFHQEDLAHAGVRFNVRPQLIGDHFRLSGVLILVKNSGKEEVFRVGESAIYSYAAAKVVVPFSVVLPPGVESVEFPTAEIDGKKTLCRIGAVLVDDKGMTAEERKMIGKPAPDLSGFQTK